MFGQEGKRNDYKSWNCQKVIGQQAPGKGEYHGCPFKTFGDDNLKQILSTYGLSSSDMNVVLDKRKENLHQVACLRLFELSHKGGIADNVGNHPNSFFNSSVAYNKEVDKKKQKAQASAPSAPMAPASKPVVGANAAKDNEMVDEQIKS
jgi:DNA primase large subunit